MKSKQTAKKMICKWNKKMEKS